MPGVVRFSDLCSGHCFNPRANSTGSEDTFTNEEKTERNGDSRQVHFCGSSSHGGTNVGSHDVFVNNRSIQIKDDPISCGCTQAMASDDVFVN